MMSAKGQKRTSSVSRRMPALGQKLTRVSKGKHDILATTTLNKEFSSLLAEQRRVSDEYRVVEKAIQELHDLLAAENVDPDDRSKMEVGVITHAAELMRLGKRMLELDAAVASSRAPSGNSDG